MEPVDFVRHVPALAQSGHDGTWTVYCPGCSDTAGEWVPRCQNWPDSMAWPTPQLIEKRES